MRARARGCRDCPLWSDATQTVFGEGNPRARIMLVGEQPGGEMAAIAPALVVALGATAAKVLLGPRFRITQGRGQVQRREGLPDVLATFHPSYLLRLKDRPGGGEAHAAFVADLRVAASYLQDKSDS